MTTGKIMNSHGKRAVKSRFAEQLERQITEQQNLRRYICAEGG
jgi:ribosomal protein L35AE/L33A